MKITEKSRRGFLQSTACLFAASPPYAHAASTEPNVLGPWPDYSPQIGTLVSEMTWIRTKVVRTAKGLTTDQLDYLLDDKANRLGALLLHLTATERIYQLVTLESGIPFWQVTISRLPSAVAAACTRIARRFPEPCYGPNLVRNSGGATGHAESGAGISPCRTRAMNRYATSLIPAGTIRPTTAITRQTPPRRSKIWRTAEDRVKIRPWVVSTRMLGGKVCLRSHATSD